MGKGMKWLRLPLGLFSFWLCHRYVDVVEIMTAIGLFQSTYTSCLLRNYWMVSEWGRDTLLLIFEDAKPLGKLYLTCVEVFVYLWGYA